MLAQNHAADLPTAQLLSQPGPTFRVPDTALKSPLSFIAYGDMRFTDPSNHTATNPAIRTWLVGKLAEEAPDAIFLNGDVPLAGDVPNDYAVYRTESKPWRAAHLRVYPTLGNHEFHGPDPQSCLENWWNAFPEFRNRRWYSVALGSRSTPSISIATRRCFRKAIRPAGSPLNCKIFPHPFSLF